MKSHPVIVTIMWVVISIVIAIILFNIKMVKIADRSLPEVEWLTDSQREAIEQDIIDRRK
jgi:hypothetical protein